MFHRLIDGEAVSAAQYLAEADFAARAPEERPYVVFNFVTTLDGRAAIDGTTRALGGDADLELLLSLRVVADAVLSGRARSAPRATGGWSPRAARRAAAGGGDLAPLRHPLGGGTVLRRRPARADLHVDRRRCPRRGRAGRGRAARPRSPAAALADLRRRGVRALLSEGGPDALPRFAGGRARGRAVPHADARCSPAMRQRPGSCPAPAAVPASLACPGCYGPGTTVPALRELNR